MAAKKQESWCLLNDEIPGVTVHATERWLLRIGNTSDAHAARVLLYIANSKSIKVPLRHATSHWGLRQTENTVSRQRKLGIRYAFAGNSILVLGGRGNVLTVLKSEPEDWATMCTWLLLGQWV